jgi:hypothetical protein
MNGVQQMEHRLESTLPLLALAIFAKKTNDDLRVALEMN